MSNFLLFATKKGLVKKTLISEYENIRASGLIALKMDEGDRLLGVKETSGEDEVVLVAAGGKAIRFSEKDIRPTGRSTRGVRGIRLGKPADSAGKDDEVIGMDTIQSSKFKVQSSKLELLIVTQNGYGKMTPVEQYSKQGRGGKGVFAAKITKKTGKVVEMRLVSAINNLPATQARLRALQAGQQSTINNQKEEKSQADLLIISSQGQVIRLPLASVPSLGRQTQGVRLIHLNEGDTVAALALLVAAGASPAN